MRVVNRSLAAAVVRMALESMRANKMRSFLTVLGVIIGVGTVIAMGAMIQGLDRTMARQIRTFGSHVLWIRPFSNNRGGPPGSLPDSLARRHNFNEGDLAAVRECLSVGLVAPLEDVDNPQISYRNGKGQRTEVMGTSPDYFQISSLGVLRGRTFTESEVRHSSQVAMVGQDVLDALFPHENAVGQTMHINNVPFIVVGEIARRGKMFGRSNDNVVIIPYTAVEKFFADSKDPARHGEFAMKAKPVDDELVEKARGEMIEVLRRRRHLRAHEGDDFVIETDDGMLNLFHQLTAGFYMVMMAISSIALLVGGIGVMNIMLVSVKERTREIGVRMAMGARRGDILSQFMLEAATLTGVGGAIGVLLGGLISSMVALFTPLPAYVAPWSIVAGLAFSVGIGLFFGIYPAFRASRLNPIEALRYE